ncbi:MAG: serine/threonine-protein kinase, partial [Planctomycetota bacterium]
SKGFFLGSYKLLRPLGKGGMGVVYLGEHHVMKRQMALKVLPSDALKDERRIDRFKEEARASAQLDHPNIVRAYDFNEASSKLYIVMEYVDGTDLHQVVARDGVMEVGAALDAIMQAASGLAHAHQRGIVHRDIKPSNLMLRADGVVKVSDMGLARIGWSGSEESNSKRLTGTADFIAPEQALNSQSVDARADIYSLGCSWYFLLTGKPPFQGSNMQQKLAKHQTAPVPDVRELREDCPSNVAAVISRMMAKRPADRPPSAVELLEQIKRVSRNSDRSASDNLAGIASGNEHAIEDSVFQASLEDTSLSGGEAITTVEIVEDFDFGSLPSLPAPSPPQTLASTPPQFRGTSTATTTANKASIKSGTESKSQTILLGIGLALAVVALLVVLFAAFKTMNAPIEPAPAKIKATESGKQSGSNVIIIRQ